MDPSRSGEIHAHWHHFAMGSVHLLASICTVAHNAMRYQHLLGHDVGGVPNPLSYQRSQLGTLNCGRSQFNLRHPRISRGLRALDYHYEAERHSLQGWVFIRSTGGCPLLRFNPAVW